MSFGFSGATDRDRYRFLSGFQLNDQGKNEDPTYLGFSMDFDFGVLGIDLDYGIPISPLFKDGSYNASGTANIFGQREYKKSSNSAFFYSAQTYLNSREGEGFNGSQSGKRSNMLNQFKILLRDITKNQPWFFQSIDGLDSLYNVARPGYQDDESTDFNGTRSATITVNTLESLNLRITALADLYNHATFDFVNMRETIPRNLRRFRMYIYVTDLRNFYKTNRLINSSTTLSTIANTANLIGSGINPGNSLAGNSTESTGSFPNDTGAQGGVFGNNLRDIARSEGLTNQQDQSGIKPVILLECSNCEFDFSESSPIGSNINSGTDSGEALGQSFKIHVGRVKIRTQYPNIRNDKNPLIISDDVFTEKSSVQKYKQVTDPEGISGRTLFGVNLGNGPAADLLEQGGNLLNNFIGNSINDLYNKGTQLLANELSGADQLLLGNAYSFNPSQVTSALSGDFSGLSLNDFTGSSSRNNSGSVKNGLPNPQTMGMGGPSENKYSPGDLGGEGIDVYPNVPGQDLGVSPPGSPIIGRVYPSLKPEDVYTGVPGKDLGVPGRAYKGPEGDVYPTVPGPDLGVPQRIYLSPRGDVYPTVPGPDLGGPQRSYPMPTGDVYPDVPGSDLGVPQRIYPMPTGDVYPDVPGPDLGAPQRVYPTVNDDFYPDVPGIDLGAPNRVYPTIQDDVYKNVPGSELGSPDRVYPAIQDDVYKNVPGSDLGVPDRSYSTINDDVYKNVPGSDLGVPGRSYKSINDKVYPEPSSNINELKSPETIYKNEVKPTSQNLGDVYEIQENQTNFKTKPSPVYPEERTKYFRGKLGDLYPPTAEDFKPEGTEDLGNLKSKDSYNISLGGKNPDPTKFNK